MAPSQIICLLGMVLTAHASPTQIPTESPSASPTYAPTQVPNPSPTFDPTPAPTHVPTPLPTPQPTACFDCPACVLCPPGDHRYTVSDGSDEATVPGMVGRFLPVSELAMSDYCPPRDVSSCPQCVCSNEDECFSCVVDSHHPGYKARAAGDDDDNVKKPTYDGELSYDDVLGDDNSSTSALFAMLNQAEKEVIDSYSKKEREEEDVLALLQADQNAELKEYLHHTNAEKMEKVNRDFSAEESSVEATIRETVAKKDQAVAQKEKSDALAKSNKAAVENVNLNALSKEEEAIQSAILKISDSTDKFDSGFKAKEPENSKVVRKEVVDSATDDVVGLLESFDKTNVANKMLGKTSEYISSSQCFMCSGFSDEVCALALTTVISDLNDKDRLSLEKSLLDTDGKTCRGLHNKNCLEKLDDTFTNMEIKDKLELLGTMCDLFMNTDITASSVKLGQHSKRDMIVEEEAIESVKEEAQMEVEEPGPVKEVANVPRFVSAHKPVLIKETSQATVTETVAPKTKKQKRVDTCEICDGFSSKTCAIALTNVISGLSDKSRLSIEKELLDKDGTACGSIKDKECLSLLDQSFAILDVSNKLDMLDTMCSLLTAADIPESSQSQVDPVAMTDDAIARTAHTLNTRDALLNANTPAKMSVHVSSDVKIDALLSALNLDDEPRCLVCDGVDDRVCLAALDASLSSLTDAQRLVVLARTMGAFPAYVSCDANDGDRSCMQKLDKAYSKLTPAHKLSVLTDACTLGAYGTAAATLAVMSSSSDTIRDVKQSMVELSENTLWEVHGLVSTVASAAADMLASRGGVASLQGGRAAKLVHTLTSWTSTVSTLAVDVVPVVSATKDTMTTSTSASSVSRAASGFAKGVRSMVTLASGSQKETELSAKSSSGDSPNMASKLGESAMGFIFGAAGAAALVYTVFAVRRSLSNQSRSYSKIPDYEPKRNDQGHESPAFVLSL